MSTREKLLLLVVLAVAPVLVGLATFGLSFQRAERVSFCADCHTMTPWIAELKDPHGAAATFQKRYYTDHDVRVLFFRCFLVRSAVFALCLFSPKGSARA